MNTLFGLDWTSKQIFFFFFRERDLKLFDRGAFVFVCDLVQAYEVLAKTNSGCEKRKDIIQ